jgi:hypothetical protein
MEFRLLGPLEARGADGSVRRISGSNLRTLLAALPFRADAVVSADDPIDHVWGRQAPLRPREARHPMAGTVTSLAEEAGSSWPGLSSRRAAVRAMSSLDSMVSSSIRACVDAPGRPQPGPRRASRRCRPLNNDTQSYLKSNMKRI